MRGCFVVQGVGGVLRYLWWSVEGGREEWFGVVEGVASYLGCGWFTEGGDGLRRIYIVKLVTEKILCYGLIDG